MTRDADILVVGPESVSDELRAVADTDSVHCADPYDAMLEMSRRSWRGVVLAAAAPELAALCRASRRLQGDAMLTALCSPADEADIGPLAPALLDDVVIYPPTRADWRRMATATRRPRRPLAVGPGRKQIATEEVIALIQASASIAELEAHLAGVVARKIGADTRWVNADEIPPGASPLLLIIDDVPRALVAAGAGAIVPPKARAFLDAVQECLPAVAAAASRVESLQKLAITDHLTGAYNRRYFYLITDRILAGAAGKGFRVTLLLYDIDDFKRYNDTYGHAAGDEILRETAALMKRITRGQDIIARIGGDEFAVLFWDPEPPRNPDSEPLGDFYELADRFRAAVESMKFSLLGPDAQGVLTISGGLAAYPKDGTDCRALLRSADKALKFGKESGKNAIHLAGHD